MFPPKLPKFLPGQSVYLWKIDKTKTVVAPENYHGEWSYHLSDASGEDEGWREDELILFTGFHNAYERKAVYAVDKILAMMPKRFVYLDGVGVVLNNARLRTFVESQKCCKCGIRATHFSVERSARLRKLKDEHGRYKTIHESTGGNYHLNLYALGQQGNEILMTKDHIIPKSKGGKDHDSNYRTMCGPCNNKRGNKDDPTTGNVAGDQPQADSRRKTTTA